MIYLNFTKTGVRNLIFFWNYSITGNMSFIEDLGSNPNNSTTFKT